MPHDTLSYTVNENAVLMRIKHYAIQNVLYLKIHESNQGGCSLLVVAQYEVPLLKLLLTFAALPAE